MRIKIKDIKRGKRVREKLGDISNLAENIKENGLIVPIVLDKNKELVDGERRLEAFKILGKDEIEYTEYPEHTIEAEASANTGKHFDVVEAVSIWNAMEKLSGGLGGSKPSDSDGMNERRIRASKLTDYSTDTLSKAKYVLSVATPEEIEAMRKNGSVSSYYRKYKLDEQKKEIEQIESIEGEYDVVVIDPPWSYGNEESYDEENFRGITPYPTMSLEEIRSIKLPTKENCVLWLWTTNTFMEEAHQIIKSWGFEKKTVLTWDKQIMGVGKWLRSQTEHCILAIKGKPFFSNTKWTTLISEKRTTHSTKPEVFYKMVDEICAGRKLDYFARKKREGWDAYGDEIK